VHYEFAHRFLPQYVHQNPYEFFTYLYGRGSPGVPMEPIRFIHSRWAMFEKMVGLVLWSAVSPHSFSRAA
jgi:hypothetical protein